MRTSEERVEELHRRMAEMKKKKQHRKMIISTLTVFAACLCLLILEASFISRMPLQTDVQIQESMTASIFASQGMLDHIVTAIIAFCLGIAFTCFCLRLKKWNDRDKHDD